MKVTRERILALTVAATIGCSLLTLFVKPRPANLEFVTPQQEIPNYYPQYPGDTKLADRVSKSYELAMILVQTPYIQKNFTALECLRRWARDRFAERPDFLHPTVLPVAPVNHDTVFGAVGYNLLAGLHGWLQEQIAQVLKWRILQFHESYAFQTFRTAYFDLFGWDAEPANLLARYENERAKTAVDIVIWAFAWLAATITAAIYLYRNRHGRFFASVQKCTAGAWTMMSLAYFLQAWTTEQASSVISFILSSAVAAYLYYPVAIISHAEAGKRIARIRFTPNWIALASWLTISVVAVQIITWIRQSMPGATDPVTMFIGSVTGNFVHDPVHGKRLVTGITTGIWLLSALWAWRQQSKTYETEFDNETNFKQLDAVAQLTR